MSADDTGRGAGRGTSKDTGRDNGTGPGTSTGGENAPSLEKPSPAAVPGTDTSGGSDAPRPMRQAASAAHHEPPAGPARRFWSVRRVPATLVAALLAVLAGLLLYDVVSVRADRPAAAWRRTLADELATRGLGDGWVVAGAVATLLLGVWLVTLSLTPGLRGLLPMRQDGEALRAGMARAAAAVVLRDRALQVSGIETVRVRVGRRRIQVRAQAHFRDLDVVRADLDTVLDHSIRELGLARPPALAVHVRRPPRR